MYYNITNHLEETNQIFDKEASQVLVFNQGSWEKEKDNLNIKLDFDLRLNHINSTKVEINYDSLTCYLNIPDLTNITNNSFKVTFIIHHNQLIFIDDSNYIHNLINRIKDSRKWKSPSCERFIYDLFEEIISNDRNYLDNYYLKLSQIEEDILNDVPNKYLQNLNKMRKKLVILRTHYNQLLDLIQEFSENENNFFEDENLKYFHLLEARLTRLLDQVSNLAEYINLNRELVRTQYEFNQNKKMTTLTIVTSIFLPLTLLTGWYGMNFKYMPELEHTLGYPLVFVVAISIIIISILYFKKRKWF